MTIQIITNKKRVISLLFFVFFFITKSELKAQTPVKCGYKMALDQLNDIDPGYKQRLAEDFYQIKNNGLNPRDEEVFRIPVVFHVIYNNDRQNIEDKYILSQLEVLNNAYRNSHNDTINTRDIFKPFAGDARIEFYLAQEDPTGNPTTGITRTQTDVESFGDIGLLLGNLNLELFEKMKYAEQGGQDAWPTNRYLNIWIADAGIDFLGNYLPALLGLATPPRYPALPDNWPAGSVDGIVDGVFLQYQTIGLDNPYKSDLLDLAGQGRTAVHEVGHYLGLRHISGDESCGDDGIDDTPTMNQTTQEANKCPDATVNTCGAGTSGDMPDQWENYMDYSNDMCQTMFTVQQVSHMRKVLTAQRDTLIHQTLNTDKKIVRAFSVFPNPATTIVTLRDLPEGGVLNMYDQVGKVIQSKKRLNSNVIDVSQMNTGFYIINYLVDNQVFTTKLFILRE